VALGKASRPLDVREEEGEGAHDGRIRDGLHTGFRIGRRATGFGGGLT
jgi:hypothetical protein